MGHGYRNISEKGSSISDNLSIVISHYPYKDGYFGKKGKKSTVRVIECFDPIKESETFYKELSKGGVEKIMKTKTSSFVVTKMADGAQVSYRVITSTEGSPAVEISLRTWNEKTQLYGLKAHKVHFIKRNVK